jgi:hypothetical protein
VDRLDQSILDARDKGRLQRLPPILAAGQRRADERRRLASRVGAVESEEIDAGGCLNEFGHAASGPRRR